MALLCCLQIFEGESLMLKVQSKFTVCGVSSKPDHPVECGEKDAESNTHFVVSFCGEAVLFC